MLKRRLSTSVISSSTICPFLVPREQPPSNSFCTQRVRNGSHGTGKMTSNSRMIESVEWNDRTGRSAEWKDERCRKERLEEQACKRAEACRVTQSSGKCFSEFLYTLGYFSIISRNSTSFLTRKPMEVFPSDFNKI